MIWVRVWLHRFQVKNTQVLKSEQATKAYFSRQYAPKTIEKQKQNKQQEKGIASTFLPNLSHQSFL